MKYVNFNDETLPVGKRKQAYIRWAMAKGTALQDAQRMANRKFGKSSNSGRYTRGVFCKSCEKKFQHSFSMNYDTQAKCPHCGNTQLEMAYG